MRAQGLSAGMRKGREKGPCRNPCPAGGATPEGTRPAHPRRQQGTASRSPCLRSSLAEEGPMPAFSCGTRRGSRRRGLQGARCVGPARHAMHSAAQRHSPQPPSLRPSGSRPSAWRSPWRPAVWGGWCGGRKPCKGETEAGSQRCAWRQTKKKLMSYMEVASEVALLRTTLPAGHTPWLPPWPCCQCRRRQSLHRPQRRGGSAGWHGMQGWA